MRINCAAYFGQAGRDTSTRRMQCPTNLPEIAILSGHLGGRNVASSRISTCLS